MYNVIQSANTNDEIFRFDDGSGAIVADFGPRFDRVFGFNWSGGHGKRNELVEKENVENAETEISKAVDG